MGSPLESETEQHSRPRVQKRKPKLGWGEGGERVGPIGSRFQGRV